MNLGSSLMRSAGRRVFPATPSGPSGSPAQCPSIVQQLKGSTCLVGGRTAFYTLTWKMKGPHLKPWQLPRGLEAGKGPGYLGKSPSTPPQV